MVPYVCTCVKAKLFELSWLYCPRAEHPKSASGAEVIKHDAKRPT